MDCLLREVAARYIARFQCIRSAPAFRAFQAKVLDGEAVHESGKTPRPPIQPPGFAWVTRCQQPCRFNHADFWVFFRCSRGDARRSSQISQLSSVKRVTTPNDSFNSPGRGQDTLQPVVSWQRTGFHLPLARKIYQQDFLFPRFGVRPMLVLSRKRDQQIIIGDGIVITVVEIRGDKVRLGIEAPTDVPVHRKEVYEAIKAHRDQPSSIKE
jgi:carbon storage regulator